MYKTSKASCFNTRLHGVRVPDDVKHNGMMRIGTGLQKASSINDSVYNMVIVPRQDYREIKISASDLILRLI